MRFPLLARSRVCDEGADRVVVKFEYRCHQLVIRVRQKDLMNRSLFSATSNRAIMNHS